MTRGISEDQPSVAIDRSSDGISGDFFSVIEIEVGSRCNRSCSYCPVSLFPNSPVATFMSQEIYCAVLAELRRLSFAGRVSYHFYNEPLLRKDLHVLVEKTRASVPQALQVVYTNGDYLTDGKYHQLRKAGVDYFIVTLHKARPYPSRSFQIVKRVEDLILSNRGGTLVHLPAPTVTETRMPCYAPRDLCVVTVNGDVVLCCEDFKREEVFGNVLETSLWEIWHSERLVEVRHRLESGRRADATSICGRCSNVAHVQPGISTVAEPFGRGGEYGTSNLPGLKQASEAARLLPEGQDRSIDARRNVGTLNG